LTIYRQPSSTEHAYYRWRLYSLLQGDSEREWSQSPFQIMKDGNIWQPPPTEE